MELFAPPKSTQSVKDISTNEPASKKQKKNETIDTENDSEEIEVKSFQTLGLVDWVCRSVKTLSYKIPTPIQRTCIPAILAGRDVIGCSETGSGKTAAFALPILQDLSQDPYGIFAIVLTPTRELAIQIAEQFNAFGISLGLRVCLVIGGMNFVEQGLQLSKRPHIVIATPGRLRHHLEGATPPNFKKAKYLVLDECDRLLAAGFQAELNTIISHMGEQRQTLLFSATMTSSLAEVEKIAMKETLRFDLTVKKKIPENLSQEYVSMPYQVKDAFLGALIMKLLSKSFNDGKDDRDSSDAYNEFENLMKKKDRKDKKKSNKKRDVNDDDDNEQGEQHSIIIFAGSCQKCQQLTELLNQLSIKSVALHSLLNQEGRMSSLNQFKNQTTRILVATDVASRGLDIPSVDLVINYDLPKVLSDYIHRIGRTARAGRSGRSISFITEHDIDLVHALEEFIGTKLTLAKDISENDAVKVLNKVSKASRMAKQKLLENGFDEKVELLHKRRQKQRRKILRNKSQETSI